MKRIITAREYKAAYRTRDEDRHIVTQKRIAFFWKMQSFNIHIFQEPVKNLCICHAQTAGNGGGDTSNEEKGIVEIPSFLDVERQLEDTSHDTEKFGTFHISLIKK